MIEGCRLQYNVMFYCICSINNKILKKDFIQTYHPRVPINKLWIIINILSSWIFFISFWISTTSSIPRPWRSTPTPPPTAPMVLPTIWFRSFFLIAMSSTSLPAPWPVAGGWAPTTIIFSVFKRIFTSYAGRFLLQLIPYFFEVILIWRFNGIGRIDGTRVSVSISVGSAYKIVVKRGFVRGCNGGSRVRWRGGRGEAETLLKFGSALSLPSELVVIRRCLFFFHFQFDVSINLI